MASKHDAKKARESYFAMQQNLARHKGQAFWMQKPKQPKINANAKAKKARQPEAEPSEKTETAEQVAEPVAAIADEIPSDLQQK